MRSMSCLCGETQVQRYHKMLATLVALEYALRVLMAFHGLTWESKAEA